MTQFRQFGGVYWSRNGVAGDQAPIRLRGGSRHYYHRKRSKAPRACNFCITFCIFTLIIILLLAAFFYVLLQRRGRDIHRDLHQSQHVDIGMESELPVNATNGMLKSKELKFGHGSATLGQDSHYWDKDDRRRDKDYNEESQKPRNAAKSMSQKESNAVANKPHTLFHHQGNVLNNATWKNRLRNNEASRNSSVEKSGKFRHDDQLQDAGKVNHKEVDDADDYDDGIDLQDDNMDDIDDAGKDKTDESGASEEGLFQTGKSSHQHQGKKKNLDIQLNSAKHSGSKKKPKRRKFSGTCEMKFLNSTALLVEPLESRKFARFSLLYTEREEKPVGDRNWEPRFAGHQSLSEREESFIAHDQKINCGFVKGPEGFRNTGFDLAEDDAKYISSCHIAVMSCIFGNSDRLRSPLSNKVSRFSRKNVCFVMFVDEETLQTLSAEGQMPDMMGFVGLWKIVVVKNLPYADMRRVGKIPKFLAHRLFPSARYSIWLDSKLRLQLDPLLILEYFLWRKGYEYGISNHYDRHCLWEEVAQNKRLNKYNHSIIDEQFAFYQADGMKRFNPLDPNKLLPSNVPEGSFIVRAHTPMANLFSCLWFNEVDRFTPRDQLSFAYTYQKLRRKNPQRPFYLNMFKDCERRKIAKLYHHRTEERRSIP
ncbi:hypothetical protein M569_12128, partial [Genlisea aurea]